MKRNRLIYLAVWILSLVGISFYGGAAPYGIFWALTLLPVILFAYLIFVLSRFKIYQKMNTTELVSRAPVSYYFTLQNETFLAFAKVRVTFYEFGADYGELDQNREYELLPHSGHKISTPIICKYRGEYDIGVRNIIISDFLNLFKITYRNREPLTINVTPAIVYPEGDMKDSQVLFSNSSTYIAPDVRDLLVRPYVEGDPLKSVNWKATAKNQKLMVSKQISESQNHIHILLDTRRTSNNPHEYLPREDELLTRLITIVLYYINKHIVVNVYYISKGYHHLALQSMNEFGDFYGEICEVVFDSDNDIPTLPMTENILIISDSGKEEEVLGDD